MKFKSLILSTAAILTFSSLSYSQVVSPTETQDSVKQETNEGKRGFKRNNKADKHRGRHQDGLKELRKLNLSEDQKARVKSIKESFKAKSAPNREEMKTLMIKKREGIITAEEQTRMKEMRSQMMESSKQIRDEIQTILTVEQKTQLEQMKSEMKERRADRPSKTPEN